MATVQRLSHEQVNSGGLDWMDEYEVSTGELKKAARHLPSILLGEQATVEDKSGRDGPPEDDQSRRMTDGRGPSTNETLSSQASPATVNHQDKKQRASTRHAVADTQSAPETEHQMQTNETPQGSDVRDPSTMESESQCHNHHDSPGVRSGEKQPSVTRYEEKLPVLPVSRLKQERSPSHQPSYTAVTKLPSLTVPEQFQHSQKPISPTKDKVFNLRLNVPVQLFSATREKYNKQQFHESVSTLPPPSRPPVPISSEQELTKRHRRSSTFPRTQRSPPVQVPSVYSHERRSTSPLLKYKMMDPSTIKASILHDRRFKGKSLTSSDLTTPSFGFTQPVTQEVATRFDSDINFALPCPQRDLAVFQDLPVPIVIRQRPHPKHSRSHSLLQHGSFQNRLPITEGSPCQGLQLVPTIVTEEEATDTHQKPQNASPSRRDFSEYGMNTRHDTSLTLTRRQQPPLSEYHPMVDESVPAQEKSLSKEAEVRISNEMDYQLHQNEENEGDKEKEEKLSEESILPVERRGSVLEIINREVTRLLEMDKITDSQINDSKEQGGEDMERREEVEGPLVDDQQDVSNGEEGGEGEENLMEIRRDVTRLLTTDTSYLVKFDPDKKTRAILNQLRAGSVHGTMEHLTADILDDYSKIMDEIDTVTYYNHRQAEEVLQDYTPRCVVLISSAVPKSRFLQAAVQPGVLAYVYDVANETYTSLLSRVRTLLDTYKQGAKAKRLAIVCKGGPGFMFLLQGKPITPAKLVKDTELLRFWKDLGSFMSKLDNKESSVVHLMESNVTGSKQGEELMLYIEAAMYSHKVKVQAPLELAPAGRVMVETYFVPSKFKFWKMNRYTKLRLY